MSNGRSPKEDKKSSLLNLITKKDCSENVIADELLKLLKNDESLLDVTFHPKRNLFHLLVKNKKAQVLDKLLSKQKNNWIELASKPDENGQTILHLAAAITHYDKDNTECAKKILETIFTYLPELSNLTDSNGNTALHLAVMQAEQTAKAQPGTSSDAIIRGNNEIVIYLSSRIDRSIQNKERKAPLNLTQNQELKRALIRLDLASIKSLGARPIASTTSTMNTIYEKLPELSSRSESSHSSPSYATTVSDEQSIGKITPCKPVNKLDSEKTKSLLAELINAYNLKLKTYNELQSQFINTCTEFQLSDNLKEIMTLQDPGKVLSNIIEQLHPHALTEYNTIQGSIQLRLKDLSVQLTRHSLTITTQLNLPPPLESLSSLLDKKPIPLEDLKRIWLITACQAEETSNRKFSFDEIRKIAIGLLCRHPFHQILISLRLLYPHFDHHQKLVSNYLVAELIQLASLNSIEISDTERMQIRFFTQQNIGESGLEIGNEINKMLSQLLDHVTLLSQRPALRNFCLLSKFMNENCLSSHSYSFNDLIDSAISLPREERAEKISLIADELKRLIISFFQQVSAMEFNECAWMKKEKESKAPHITEHIQSIEAISYYFIEKVLTQKSDNLKNALEMLIDLARAICSLADENFPDLNHTMALTLVFLNSNINRLKNALSTLSEIDKKVLEELEIITNPENNYGMMTAIYQTNQTTLPLVTRLLNHICSAHEAEKSCDEAEPVTVGIYKSLGAVLLTLFETKLVVNFMISYPQTDLRSFLKSYTKPTDEHLDSLSLTHQPKLADAEKPTHKTKKQRKRSHSALSRKVILFKEETMPNNKETGGSFTFRKD